MCGATYQNCMRRDSFSKFREIAVYGKFKCSQYLTLEIASILMNLLTLLYTTAQMCLQIELNDMTNKVFNEKVFSGLFSVPLIKIASKDFVFVVLVTEKRCQAVYIILTAKMFVFQNLLSNMVNSSSHTCIFLTIVRPQRL